MRFKGLPAPRPAAGPGLTVPPLSSSLCCQCGVPIPPNPANMCVGCLRAQVDITEGIPKQGTLHFCKQCERWAAGPPPPLPGGSGPARRGRGGL